MKNLINNSTNEILVIKSGISLLDLQTAVLRQLGSDKETTISLVTISEDCFTAVLSLTLTENQLPNATYTLKGLDSLSKVLITLTIEVSGNTDEIRAYIIE